MYNATNRHHAPSKIADLEPLRDIAQTTRKGECPFLGRLSRRAGDLRRWLTRTGPDGRARFRPEALDDRTLSDIGIPRIEALYWDPK